MSLNAMAPCFTPAQHTAAPCTSAARSSRLSQRPRSRTHKHKVHAHRPHKGFPQQCWMPVQFSYVPEDFEPLPTPAELEELEACDTWVATMADLDQAEREHLIAYALSHTEEDGRESKVTVVAQ